MKNPSRRCPYCQTFINLATQQRVAHTGCDLFVTQCCGRAVALDELGVRLLTVAEQKDERVVRRLALVTRTIGEREWSGQPRAVERDARLLGGK